jgi:hypothetical protein
MILFFQGGRERIAFNTDTQVYQQGFYELGGWKEYIKVSATNIREIIATCVNDGYKEGKVREQGN